MWKGEDVGRENLEQSWKSAFYVVGGVLQRQRVPHRQFTAERETISAIQ